MYAIRSYYAFLANKYNPVVIEGAGSISELNLRSRDITNMRVAIAAGAATFLVADIDRGGVFASVYGTIMLLTPEERKQMKGIIINKFRGDISLFYDVITSYSIHYTKLYENLAWLPDIKCGKNQTDFRIWECQML